jgi:hypothetical protein
MTGYRAVGRCGAAGYDAAIYDSGFIFSAVGVNPSFESK